MKSAEKFLTLCVLAGVVVAMCGCTSPSNNAVPTVTSTAHNNTTKTAVKTTKAVVKPTATVAPAAVATPVPNSNMPKGTPTTTPTAEPTIRNLHGEDQSTWVPTATPTVTKIPTQVSISGNTNPIKSGTDITFTFTVSAKTVPIPGQTVSFDASGKQLGSATTGSNGYGTFTFSTAGLVPLLPGDITIGGTYAGTSQYASSWGTMGYYIIA
jgi:hypothetical protein